ncbi:MAG: aminotransferase class V-fold PLP-dependent enzyme [Ignavibacterium album]|jgi:selenocysteine lyase/cysteine desulfurase|uniref:aminotransferase class V-fold PLP-dependent enzyme n=1 Tax=Ignavibacterium album TaxID=591197 RepID=UPI0026ECD687|nr:aminotransferase class V-fold PLP-dependent enzyme [Ignavibacterium album]MCX8106867.1 aminotransferase class V-fold PLP-dependent enzyme [Ignavibacterium album]
MTVEDIRQLFPFIKNGITYLNHASTAPISSVVKDRIANFLKEKSESRIDDYFAFMKVYEETKKLLGELINADPDRIAFIDNTSTGLNILATGIQWKEGDRVLLNDAEFPANVYPFLNLERLGVKVDFVNSEGGIVSAEDLISNVKPETKIISVSFVQFLSGYKIDLEKLGSFCRANNIILSIDGIQGIGALDFDVKKLKIDFLSCGTQKWLFGAQGLGFIYLTKELQSQIHPAYVGWLSVEDAWNILDYKMELKKSANVFEGGTLNSLGIYIFNTSLKMLKDFGFDRIEDRVISNTEYLRNKLNEMGIKTLTDGVDKKHLSGITTFKTDNTEKLYKYLEDEKIVCSLREGYIRLSPHFYNTIEDIDRVINAINKFRN